MRALGQDTVMEEDKGIIAEVMSHYDAWTEDNEQRRTRKHGWNDITDAYYGVLPDDWPFQSRIIDPVLRTTLIEKNARLINGKLKGRLVPRESGDLLGAHIGNAVLDFQWDNAQDGGSMLTKLSICDMDTRLYQSKFALIVWKYEEKDGEPIFDGNEMYPLDIRDCGMDYSADHIKNAKWFQHRSWEFLEDLENAVDANGEPIYSNLGEIKRMIMERGNKKKGKSSRKENRYLSRIREVKGLDERIGTDPSFPVIEICTEYRNDKWITFAPEYKVVLREIANPYKHGKIPVAQLRYYPIQDDALGESEVECVLPLWKSIQATFSGYMDEVILKIRPPLKIIENQARMETIVYGPEAQWIVNSVDAVTEHQSSGDTIRYFETTLGALKSAFSMAMGDMSQGVSNMDPFAKDKTATEVKATMKQQNARDQKNQLDLSEFIKDIMLMWHSNNIQFLFSNPKRREYLIRIIGKEKFSYLERSGMGAMEIMPETMNQIVDVINMRNGDIYDNELQSLMSLGQTPKFPIIENPKEKDITKLKIRPKMKISDMGDVAEITVVPEDLQGTYDYIADVRSMAASQTDELMQARQKALELFTANPVVLQLLQQEGYKPKIKEIISSNLEDFGLSDAERFFEKNDQIGPAQAGIRPAGGVGQPVDVNGLPAAPQAVPNPSPVQQVAGPSPVYG